MRQAWVKDPQPQAGRIYRTMMWVELLPSPCGIDLAA